MTEKVNNILRENNILKTELERLVQIIKENEAKQKGFRLVEDAFLLAESVDDIDKKALSYLEDIFSIDSARLFVDSELFNSELSFSEDYMRVIPTNEKILRYAYIEKRPYFGTFIDGLINEFRIFDEIGSYLICPIIEEGRIIASLNMYSRDPERLAGEGHSDFVQQLSLRVAIALRKLHNAEVIKYQAQRDFLTGVYNKSMLYNLLNRYIQRYKRTSEGFSFIITDMDNFKALNDSHGHIVGDNVLKELTSQISDLLDDTEIIGRFGGDEFYLITGRTSDIAVQSLFAKISEIVATMDMNYDMNGLLGISGGYIIYPKNIESGDPLEIVKGADAGLYYSKTVSKGVCSGAVSHPDHPYPGRDIQL